jgi:hypothetical protein
MGKTNPLDLDWYVLCLFGTKETKSTAIDTQAEMLESNTREINLTSDVPGGGPKFRGFAQAEPNSQFRGIYIHNNLIRKWVSFIRKLSGTPD